MGGEGGGEYKYFVEGRNFLSKVHKLCYILWSGIIGTFIVVGGVKVLCGRAKFSIKDP